MKDIKINILYNFQKGPWGGANQFLKALRREFQKMGIYEKDPNKAQCILFNSHHNVENLLILKLKNPQKIFIHRVDGPISEYRNKDFEIDKMIYFFNDLIADGTIFQSDWSKKENFRLGMKKNMYETTIANAPDPDIFNKRNKIKFDDARKIKLISISWSPNWNKGFKIYQFLDENLDFSRYKMTFIGNSPLKFKNIEWIKPVDSKKLAEYLKRHDIYIVASKNDPCSNSLIEALNCGLPAVALNDGGHPEIVRNGGELFNT